MSVMTVIIMLLSNIEFKETWVDDYIDGDPETLQYAAFSFLLLALFTLLVPILLMNLLVSFYEMILEPYAGLSVVLVDPYGEKA